MSQPFTGSLQVKKKAELQEIAQALGVPDTGTRDEIQRRIKSHLDDNSSDLEADPNFSGLYTRKRQRSVQPAAHSPDVPTTRSAATKLQPVVERETTDEETNNTSAALPRAPLSPLNSRAGPPSSPIKPRSPLKTMSPAAVSSPISTSRKSPPRTPRVAQQTIQPTVQPTIQPTAQQTAQAPASPSRGTIADVIAQPQLQTVVAMERNVVAGFIRAMHWNRTSLSSGRTIFGVTAFLELVYIMLAIHKFEHFPILPIAVQAEPALRVTVYATLSWATPTLLLPLIVGYLISFSSPTTLTFDVLSASIIRVASNIAFYFPAIAVAELANEGQSLDVVGFKWRVLSASIALAFAFAEAINRRPVSSEKTGNKKNE